MSEGCSFSFDPTEVESTTISEIWNCPHDSYGEEQYCVFHLGRSSQDAESSTHELTESFVQGLESDNPNRSQFIGLRAEELDLSELDLHSVGSDSVDLRHSSIDFMNLSSVRVDEVFRCDDSEIGVLRAPVSEFLDRVRLCGCRFGMVDFQLATFERYANFNESIFEEAYFSSASFDQVRFNECQFRETASFHQSIFKEWTDFDDAEFSGTILFSQARFDDDVTFARATFTGEQCSFKECRFLRKATFDQVQATTSLDFANIECKGIHQFQLRAPENDIIVSFRNANLRQGNISIVLGEREENTDELQYTPEGEVSIDFTGAFLGNVGLRNYIIIEDIVEESVDSKSYSRSEIYLAIDLDNLRFVRTTFDGFDFSAHHESLLECDWNIHQFSNSDVESPLSSKFTNDPNHTDLEETYLKAKNGARSAGDNRAASEFFIREMRQRRAQHYSRAFSDSSTFERLKGLMSTVANDTLYLTAGYGERPIRVIGTSLGIILLCTIFFQASFSTNLATPGSWVESILFSFQSFNTFIIGPPPSGTESVFVRLLSAFEGFLGAFLVALFVFTLTRSVHR